MLENLGTQPATHDVLSWLIDHGVQVRTPHTVYGIKGASPLGFLIGTVQNQDMSCPTWLTCATQLWELLEAAGDDPHTAVGNLRSPVNRLATVPPLQKWYEGRNLARQRQEQASAVVGAQRRRLRS